MNDKFSISSSIKNIIVDFVVYSIFFGWIAYFVLDETIEDKTIIILIIIILLLIASIITELKDIDTSIKNIYINAYKKIDAEKEKMIKQFDDYSKEKNIELSDREMILNSKEKIIDDYLNDELAYKPYLATSISDLKWYCDYNVAERLMHKSRPAIKASEEVKKIAKEKRKIEKELRIIKYQISIYEELFPDLLKYKEATVKDIDEYIDDNIYDDDKARYYLSIEEWNNLSKIEKYQLSLDRYKKSNKTKWQIGRDFERYIGYQYEIKGYKVIYNGAKEGLEDLGRDLIALNKNEILIIQCKYWSENKTIHEKHIFQLYGTTLLKQLENKQKNVKGIFICTNKLSNKAKEIANILNIEILENCEFNKNYPCIKCNISKSTGEKIYHLPFDQQYDNIDIELSKGEKYVSTIKEAEDLGFRRAKKYKIID